VIADTHVHVASHNTDRFPLHPLRAGGSEWWRQPVSAEDLLAVMDAHQVDRAVLVHALGAYSYDCAYTVEAARVDPDRLRAVVAVDMAGPDPAGALEALVDPVVSGVRLLSIGPGDTPWYTDPRSHRVWRVAGEAGLSVIVMAREAQLAAFRPAIMSEPRVVTVIDHCGLPELEGGVVPASSPLLELADLPNVWVKVSTPVLLAASGPGSPARLMEQLVERFGAGRVVWGSDFPQTAKLDYAGKLALASVATAGLPAGERDAVMAANAASLWFADGRPTTR
jgi:predicted TIM-barrel fold metal-dependent hydrolase